MKTSRKIKSAIVAMAGAGAMVGSPAFACFTQNEIDIASDNYEAASQQVDTAQNEHDSQQPVLEGQKSSSITACLAQSNPPPYATCEADAESAYQAAIQPLLDAITAAISARDTAWTEYDIKLNNPCS